jgi:hypothetical protein
MRRVLCLITLLLAVAAFARSVDPTTIKLIPRAMPEAVVRDTPWGAAVDGLQCRLLAKPRYAVGEPLWLEVEIKNVSAVERLVPQLFAIYTPQFAALTITGPKGTVLPQGLKGSAVLAPRLIKPIAAGAVVRVVVPDASAYFRQWNPVTRTSENPFDTPGAYSATVKVTLPEVPRRLLESTTYNNGQKTENFKEYTDAEMAAMWHGTLTSAPMAFTVEALTPRDLTVHEWGVFTAFPDMAYANANRKAEWGTLPEVFYRQFPTQRLRWIPSAWDKPVINFFTPHDSLRCRVSIDFGTGYPVAWWPCAAEPIDSGGRTPAVGKPFHTLTWDLTLGTHLPTEQYTTWERGGWRPATLFPLPDTSWVVQARLPSAACVSTDGTIVKRSAPWMSGQTETERFVYYDGLVPAPEYLRCTASDAKSVTLQNTAAFPLAPVFVIDRRGTTTRFTRVAAIAPGESAKVTPAAVATTDWPKAGETAVADALRAAGLFPDEAASLLTIWRDGFFQRPGLTVFYLLPQAEYDRLLPLTITPKPPKLVRVGIAVHPNCDTEPARTALAQALVAGVAADAAAQPAAASRLADLGPVGVRALKDALANNPPATVKARLQAVLDAVDVSSYFTPPSAAPAGK